MINLLNRITEEQFGIKADPGDLQKLHAYLLNTYGEGSPGFVNKVFSSGEAADFLTVNETYFFREPAHFSLLWDLLPSFEGTCVQICSAAAATGCEAYSIAMLIEAYNRSGRKPLSYHIDAFDINPKVIEIARQGIYSDRALREDGSCFRYMADPYLKKLEDDPRRGSQEPRFLSGYQVDDSLKKNMRFFVHNVMDELPPKSYDIIFFRNAFIYFLPQNRDRILSNLSAVLKEGGILFLGVSETAGAHHACLDEKNRNDVFYFQKSLGFTGGFSPDYYQDAFLKQNAG